MNHRLDWGSGTWDRILSIILALAILGALGMVGYIITEPEREEFTEFYLLGLSGGAVDYPTQLTIGEEGKVTVGIVNGEQKTITYRIEVAIDGITSNKMVPVILKPDEKWENIVSFTPVRAGDGQKVEFLLYRQGQSEVYHQLYLWLNVR